jgi:hypothetical protein
VRFGSRSFPGWTTADYFTFPSLFHLIFFQHAHSKQRVGQKTLQYAQALLIHIQEFYSTSQSAISSQLVSATILLVSSAPVLCRILYQCLPQSSTATLYIYHPSGDVMWSLFVLDLIVFCTLSIAAFPYHLLAFSGPFLVKLCLSIWPSVASTKLGFYQQNTTQDLCIYLPSYFLFSCISTYHHHARRLNVILNAPVSRLSLREIQISS